MFIFTFLPIFCLLHSFLIIYPCFRNLIFRITNTH